MKTDEELLRLYAETRDRVALVALVDRHLRRIAALVADYLGQRATPRAVGEIVRNTLIDLRKLRNLAPYLRDGSIRSLLDERAEWRSAAYLKRWDRAA